MRCLMMWDSQGAQWELAHLPVQELWEARVRPWVGKSPWRKAWQPTVVFLLGNPMDRGAWWATQSVGSQRVGHDRAHTHTHKMSHNK